MGQLIVGPTAGSAVGDTQLAGCTAGPPAAAVVVVEPDNLTFPEPDSGTSGLDRLLSAAGRSSASDGQGPMVAGPSGESRIAEQPHPPVGIGCKWVEALDAGRRAAVVGRMSKADQLEVRPPARNIEQSKRHRDPSSNVAVVAVAGVVE